MAVDQRVCTYTWQTTSIVYKSYGHTRNSTSLKGRTQKTGQTPQKVTSATLTNTPEKEQLEMEMAAKNY